MSCSACTAPQCREKAVKSDEFSRAKLSQAQTRISCNSLQTLVFVYLSEGVDPNPRREVKHIKVAAKVRKMSRFMAPYLRHLAALSCSLCGCQLSLPPPLVTLTFHPPSSQLRATEGHLPLCQGDRRR